MKPRRIKLDLDAVSADWRKIRPAGGFAKISIDCPWDFSNRSIAGEDKNPNAHYPVMSIEDICQLPLHLLAADNCAVFSWKTWPLMMEWPNVIKAWGFDYAGLAWEWIKFNPETGKYAFGLGYGTRKNLEPCLLLTKGDPQLRPGELEFFGTKVETGARSVRDFILAFPADTIRAPRREHSRKPDEHYSRIDTMFDGPAIDIFGREARPGWTIWGNEINKFTASAPA